MQQVIDCDKQNLERILEHTQKKLHLNRILLREERQKHQNLLRDTNNQRCQDATTIKELRSIARCCSAAKQRRINEEEMLTNALSDMDDILSRETALNTQLRSILSVQQ